jgi:hypothetical protein
MTNDNILNVSSAIETSKGQGNIFIAGNCVTELSRERYLCSKK